MNSAFRARSTPKAPDPLRIQVHDHQILSYQIVGRVGEEKGHASGQWIMDRTTS